jgi:S1-C subfamily serine protease
MDLPDVIDAVRPCVVQVFAAIRDLTDGQGARSDIAARIARNPYPGSLVYILGTGFFVSEEGHVVTAAHVIDGAVAVSDAWPDNEVIIGFGLAVRTGNQLQQFAFLGGEIIRGDRTYDLALLRTQDGIPFAQPFQADDGGELEIPHAAARIRPNIPRDGTPIACSGYPLNEATLVTSQGVIASAAWLPSPDATTTQWPRYLGDIQTNPGNSGGPVYDATDGVVLGVLVAGWQAPITEAGAQTPLGADAGISVIVPSRFLIGFLMRNGVPWIHADPPTA